MRNIRLILVLSVVYIDMLGTGLAYPILPKLIEHFQHGSVSRASYAFGLLASAFSVTQFLLAPLIGGLSDRFGRRPVLLLSLAGSAISYALMAAAPGLLVLAIGRLIAGAMGGSVSAAGAYLADITPPEKRSQTFGLIGAAFGFGFITGPAIGGLLGAIDLHLPFLAAAGLCALDFVFAFFALPESLKVEHRRAFSFRGANPVGAVRLIARHGQVATLMVIYILAVFANRSAEMVWVLYTGYRFHWGTAEVGVSLAVIGVVFIVGQGWFSRILIPWLGERRAIVLGLAASVVVCAGYGLVTKGWMVYLIMPFAIFGWIAAQPAVQGLMSSLIPQNEQGLLQGAMASLTGLTSIVGPAIWTGLFGYFVSPAAPFILPGAAFYAAAAIFLVALLLALRWAAATSPVVAEASS